MEGEAPEAPLNDVTGAAGSPGVMSLVGGFPGMMSLVGVPLSDVTMGRREAPLSDVTGGGCPRVRSLGRLVASLE